MEELSSAEKQVPLTTVFRRCVGWLIGFGMFVSALRYGFIVRPVESLKLHFIEFLRLGTLLSSILIVAFLLYLVFAGIARKRQWWSESSDE